MRALFIYWKVLPDHLAGALAEARAFQADLLLRTPALAARLYQRADAAGPTVTVMETYAHAGGLEAPLLRDIIDSSQVALAPWATSGRHVEQFDQLND